VSESLQLPSPEQFGLSDMNQFQDLSPEALEICEHFYKVNIAIVSIDEDCLRMNAKPGKASECFIFY
jgi:hypothetical protein